MNLFPGCEGGGLARIKVCEGEARYGMGQDDEEDEIEGFELRNGEETAGEVHCCWKACEFSAVCVREDSERKSEVKVSLIDYIGMPYNDARTACLCLDWCERTAR